MNQDILRYYLPQFLNYKDFLNFCIMDRETYKLMEKSLCAKRTQIIEHLKNTFPLRVLDLVGLNKLLFGEKTEWDDKWMGNTQYIDRVRAKDLTHNVCYGIDCYERPFIFYKIDNYVFVIFKRYSDSGMFVVIEPLTGFPLIMKGRCALDDELAKDLKEFFNNSCFSV